MPALGSGAGRPSGPARSSTSSPSSSEQIIPLVLPTSWTTSVTVPAVGVEVGEADRHALAVRVERGGSRTGPAARARRRAARRRRRASSPGSARVSRERSASSLLEQGVRVHRLQPLPAALDLAPRSRRGRSANSGRQRCFVLPIEPSHSAIGIRRPSGSGSYVIVVMCRSISYSGKKHESTAPRTAFDARVVGGEPVERAGDEDLAVRHPLVLRVPLRLRALREQVVGEALDAREDVRDVRRRHDLRHVLVVEATCRARRGRRSLVDVRWPSGVE